MSRKSKGIGYLTLLQSVDTFTALLSPPPRKSPGFRHGDRSGVPLVNAQVGLDLGLKSMVILLQYKSQWYGRALITIDRWYPSSKTCYDCRHVVEDLPLDVREWVCPQCGVWHDRDSNAAKNILAEGLSVAACGGGVRPARAKARTGNPQRNRKAYEKYDRAEKFARYRYCSTLEVYVLVSQDEPYVEVYRRANNWRQEHFLADQIAKLDQLNLELPLTLIYEGVFA